MWYITSCLICLPLIVFCETRNRSAIRERILCSPNSRNLLVYKLLLSYVYIFFKSAFYHAHRSEYIQCTTSVCMSSVLLITLLTIAKEIRFLRATPNYSNLVVVPFEYFSKNPEVTGFSRALTDEKAVLP